eukprot:gb/GFBE01053305.1/.p1 GENE.gb/GFBE01053305.1/~~gb/GFBE01053305.1/.p1  ORF type:complete len:237 (+),score=53.13 gb/GFBE01053305.1/:1-711(+)
MSGEPVPSFSEFRDTLAERIASASRIRSWPSVAMAALGNDRRLGNELSAIVKWELQSNEAPALFLVRAAWVTGGTQPETEYWRLSVVYERSLHEYVELVSQNGVEWSKSSEPDPYWCSEEDFQSLPFLEGMFKGSMIVSADLSTEVQQKKRLLGIFRSADTNKDGVISKLELTKVLVQLNGRVFKEHALDGLFKVIDQDGNGRIAYSEFIAWLFGEDFQMGKSRQDKVVWMPARSV